MTYYIQSNSRPINSAEYATVADAFAAARAPQWAGAGETKITVTGETTYTYLGDLYHVVEGRNPKAAQQAKPTTSAAPPRSALDHNGRFRGSAWLSREMDREDSDY